MNHFHYRGRSLCAEEVPLAAIAAAVGTPTYVYSSATLNRHFQVLSAAFADAETLLCYSVKASSSLALLRLFGQAGAGFDIVSGGELERVRTACPEAIERVVFSGVGKTSDEMVNALAAGILLFNVESAEELAALDRVGCALGRRAPFALRVNPEVDARTHRYIATGLRESKFGVPFAEARRLYRSSLKMKGVLPLGLDCHIGSQLTSLAPVRSAVKKVADLYRVLQADGLGLKLLDLGGGLGITYRDEQPPSPEEYARAVREASRGLDARWVLEPGRMLVGNAAVLLTRVLYRKKTPSRQFVVVDAGMNDLLRPALYEAHHQILPVEKRAGRSCVADVVGPVCESSDVLARQRRLVLPRQDDLLAVMSAGAYGMSMASNYNSRPRPAEVLVEGDAYRIIRERESIQDLWRGETP